MLIPQIRKGPDTVSVVGDRRARHRLNRRMIRILTFLILALFGLTVGVCSAESIFQIPEGVAVIEDSAFESLDCENVYIGRDVIAIGENAFGGKVATVYGYTGSEAERYARENGKTFYALDAYDLQTEARINTGETLKLDTNLSASDPVLRTLRWESTDTKIAVFLDGKITGKQHGECEIRAYIQNLLIASCRVRVVTPVKTVKLNASSVTVNLYETYTLTASFTPKDADETELSWISSNEEIVTVDENGLLTALKAGTCTVTATAPSGARASCKLTVKETKLTSFGFNELFITLYPGQTHELGIHTVPEIAQNKRLNYQSSDPSVAYVDENGVLHAQAVGNAVITGVSQATPGASNTCKVFVIREDALPLEGVVIGINPGHQKRGINTLYPIAPGSSTMKVGCKVGTQGIKSRVTEYEVNLEVSLILKDMLAEAGATVVMTRTENDVYLTNIDRAEILNKAKVDAAIQVHCNG